MMNGKFARPEDINFMDGEGSLSEVDHQVYCNTLTGNYSIQEGAKQKKDVAEDSTNLEAAIKEFRVDKKGNFVSGVVTVEGREVKIKRGDLDYNEDTGRRIFEGNLRGLKRSFMEYDATKGTAYFFMDGRDIKIELKGKDFFRQV